MNLHDLAVKLDALERSVTSLKELTGESVRKSERSLAQHNTNTNAQIGELATKIAELERTQRALLTPELPPVDEMTIEELEAEMPIRIAGHQRRS